MSGDKFIFLKGANNYYKKEDVFVDIKYCCCVLTLDEYDTKLFHLKDHSYDIVKICNHSSVEANLAKHISNDKSTNYVFSPYYTWTAVR